MVIDPETLEPLHKLSPYGEKCYMDLIIGLAIENEELKHDRKARRNKVLHEIYMPIHKSLKNNGTRNPDDRFAVLSRVFKT